MPPERCPECGRFLKQELVAALADGPAACPGCDMQLDAATFAPGDGHAAGASVRPPDLPPETVRDERDPLAGWDVGASPEEIAGWRDDTPPFPADTAIVLASGLTGVLAGALLGDGRRGRAAALGGLAGVVLAAAARRVWRLTP